MAKITVGSLKNQTGEVGPHPFLYCPSCHNEFSANAGDYFMLPLSHVFKCGTPECRRRNLLLVTRTVQYEEVQS